jgi:hypothetical protein
LPALPRIKSAELLPLIVPLPAAKLVKLRPAQAGGLSELGVIVSRKCLNQETGKSLAAATALPMLKIASIGSMAKKMVLLGSLRFMFMMRKYYR